MEDNETTAAPMTQQQTAGLTCYAAACRFNRGGCCNILALEIGKSGRCLNFEERTADKLRQYLAERGLTQAAIDQIIAEDAKNAQPD